MIGCAEPGDGVVALGRMQSGNKGMANTVNAVLE